MVSASSDLKAIAEKCPFSDGTVIYQARALYSLLFDNYEIFQDNCEIEILSKSMILANEDSIPVTSLQLYPNPTTNELFIRFENKEISQIELRVIDVNGKIIMSDPKLVVNDGLTKLSLDLEQGIYFVYIYGNQLDERYVEKIVVQK